MKDNKIKTFADNLRAERNRKHLSQEGLAEIADLSMQTISKIERCIQVPSVFTAYDIAKALEIDINDLLKGI
ncbi:helix-turn-helix transcriptional regulator [bacterium]|nr:helix-turn-helix transcriptional regulator [bacterium]